MLEFDPEHDLNACRLFEEVFAERGLLGTYVDNLVREFQGATTSIGDWITAPAPQRLRAAVMTVEEIER